MIDLFLFLEKALREVKASDQHLNSINLGSVGLGNTIKENCMKSQTVGLKISSNMCIAIVCFAGCEVINFESHLSFSFEPF